MSDKRVYLYDSTLRDGQQTQGVDFSAADKTAIAKALDELSIDYIEGGWPGANPTDDAFFANPPKLKNSKLTAFGMTYGSPDPQTGLANCRKTPHSATALRKMGFSGNFTPYPLPNPSLG